MLSLSASSSSPVSAYSDINLRHSTFGRAIAISGIAITKNEIDTINTYSNLATIDSAKRSASVIKDFDGDGYDDLIIGDPYAAKCYVLFGNSNGLTNMTTGFTIFGEKEGDLTGWSVSGAGDVNNDTIKDIVIGAPFARGMGAVYVIYGKNYSDDIYLDNLDPTLGHVLYGAFRSDSLGISVSNAGDVNGDGCDDILVGAVSAISYYAGAAYIVYGGQSLQSINSTAQLTESQGCKLSGASYMYAGVSLSSAGDVNKDGFDDVIVGSNPTVASLEQSAYLVFGSNVLGNLMFNKLTSNQGIRIAGGGIIVVGAGDVNGDNFDDILIGSSITITDASVIVHTNINSLTMVTDAPTLLPSVRPSSAMPIINSSRQPTVIPSTKITKAPIVSPSKSPIIYSEAPTELRTETPTIEPSIEPSDPPTVNPSVEPTDAPTVAPSVEPSESPTRPSEKTTASPSTLSPTESTRQPIHSPTFAPSVQMTFPARIDYVVQGSSVVFNDSASTIATRYVVNATGESTIDPARNTNSYLVVPNTELILTIWRFDVTCDVIDLSLIDSINGFSDVVMKAGSVIIDLPTNQIIHIMNQEPAAMSESNFIFRVADDDQGKFEAAIVESLVIVLPVCFVLLVAYQVYRHYKWLTMKRKVITDDNRYLGKFDTDRSGNYIFEVDSDPVDSDHSVVEIDRKILPPRIDVNRPSDNVVENIEASESITVSSETIEDVADEVEEEDTSPLHKEKVESISVSSMSEPMSDVTINSEGVLVDRIITAKAVKPAVKKVTFRDDSSVSSSDDGVDSIESHVISSDISSKEKWFNDDN